MFATIGVLCLGAGVIQNARYLQTLTVPFSNDEELALPVSIVSNSQDSATNVSFNSSHEISQLDSDSSRALSMNESLLGHANKLTNFTYIYKPNLEPNFNATPGDHGRQQPEQSQNKATIPWNTTALAQKPNIYIMLHGFKGRLGNYLLQYSSALGLAHRIGARLCLTSKTLKKRAAVHTFFQGPFARLCPKKMAPDRDWVEHHGKYQGDEFIREALDSCNTSKSACAYRMTGYWSSHLYFDSIREELLKVWNLTEPYYSQVQTYFRQLPDVTYIGIHIRRGDMMAVQVYEIPGMEYYHAAMEHYRAMYNHSNSIQFYVASDDKAWCRRHFDSIPNVTILPDDLQASVELFLLGNCRHVITSVGTFGWWSAYLTQENIAIYPIKAYKDEKWWTDERLSDFIPYTWSGI